MRVIFLLRGRTWLFHAMNATRNRISGTSGKLESTARIATRIFTRILLKRNITLMQIVWLVIMNPDGLISCLIMQKLNSPWQALILRRVAGHVISKRMQQVHLSKNSRDYLRVVQIAIQTNIAASSRKMAWRTVQSAILQKAGRRQSLTTIKLHSDLTESILMWPVINAISLSRKDQILSFCIN